MCGWVWQTEHHARAGAHTGKALRLGPVKQPRPAMRTLAGHELSIANGDSQAGVACGSAVEQHTAFTCSPKPVCGSACSEQ